MSRLRKLTGEFNGFMLLGMRNRTFVISRSFAFWAEWSSTIWRRCLKGKGCGGGEGVLDWKFPFRKVLAWFAELFSNFPPFLCRVNLSSFVDTHIGGSVANLSKSLATTFSGLKNDSTPEVFELKHKTHDNEEFPILFLQVIPLLSYGPSFNFSIWYIELLGLEDDFIVTSTMMGYNEKKEKTTIRLILKHLRNKGHFEAFNALSKETNIQLEDPEITNLYQCLVDNGEFSTVEKIMEKLIDGKDYNIYFLNSTFFF